MVERVFQSSLDDLVSGRVIPPEMLRDLHAIANLSEETCTQIAEAIRGLKGLNASDAIGKAVKNCLGDQDAGKTESILSALKSLESKAIPGLIESIAAWVSVNESRREVFSEAVLQRLARNLRLLISDLREVALMQKADQLLRDVGNELVDMKFVCDLRPVFDKPRENVEGFVLLANMRLIYASQDGNKHTCEIALTEDELKKLWENADKALKKLGVLNDIRSTLKVDQVDKEDPQ